MRSSLCLTTVGVLILARISCASGLAQSAPPENATVSSAPPDATQIVANAKAALAPPAGINQVTLTGRVQFIAGSLNQQGNITLVASNDGSYTITYDIPQGPKAETQTALQPDQTCSWTDKGGIVHATVQFNCMTGVAWFLPTMTMFGGKQPATVSFSSSGTNALDGLSLVNLTQTTAFESPHSSSLMVHLSTFSLFLSPSTYMPAIAMFAVHPDNNSFVDIPVKITYSNYQQVGRMSIPFHIQKFLNGTLALDITASSASVQ